MVVLQGEKYGEGYKLEFKLLDSDLEEIEALSTLSQNQNMGLKMGLQ